MKELILSICISLSFVFCSVSGQNIELRFATTKGIEFDTTSCYIMKRGKERLLFQAPDSLFLDTILYNSKSLYIVEQDVYTQDFTSKYFVYDEANDNLYESDYNTIYGDFLLPGELKELFDMLEANWSQEHPAPMSIWKTDSVSSDFSKIFIRYWNGRINELDLRQIPIPSRL